jgi:hypothetical protein
LCWPRDTHYPLKLALTSPTSGGRSVGVVRLRTKGHGVRSHLWSSILISYKIGLVGGLHIASTVKVICHSGLLGFGFCTLSGIVRNTFRKLHLFPSSGEGGGRHSVGSIRNSWSESLDNILWWIWSFATQRLTIGQVPAAMG